MSSVNRIEELREEKELKRKEIAEILGVSDSVYCRWEKNRCAIPTRRLYQLANYYEVSIDYMLGYVKERRKIVSCKNIDILLVSKRVREMIKMSNQTLDSLAKEWNTTKSTISAYQTGKVLILYTFLEKLCDITHCSFDWVLGRSDIKFLNTKK